MVGPDVAAHSIPTFHRFPSKPDVSVASPTCWNEATPWKACRVFLCLPVAAVVASSGVVGLMPPASSLVGPLIFFPLRLAGCEVLPLRGVDFPGGGGSSRAGANREYRLLFSCRCFCTPNLAGVVACCRRCYRCFVGVCLLLVLIVFRVANAACRVVDDASVEHPPSSPPSPPLVR